MPGSAKRNEGKALNFRIVFLGVGIALAVIGILIRLLKADVSVQDPEFWSDVAINLALVFIAVVLVDFLWHVLGGDPVTETLNDSIGETRKALDEMRTAVPLVQDSKRTGLHRLLSASGAFATHEHWMARLQQSGEQIDLMGYSLLVWTKGDRFEEELAARVREGVRVRVLIMDESNPHLASLLNHHQIASVALEHARQEIVTSKRVFTRLADDLRTSSSGSFEFRVLKKGLIVAQICRTDSRMTAVQYLYSVVASRSPLLEIHGEGTQLFMAYMYEFDRLWDLAESA